MPSLELPKTTRFAEEQEVSRSYWNKIAARREAHFVEGFVLTEVEEPEQLFRFYAEVNVNNSRLWELFTDLAAMLPDACACLFCWHEDTDDVTSGELQAKELTLSILNSVQRELVGRASAPKVS